ncbi:MAG: amidohydrolase [Bacillota bacterium]
MQLDQQILTLVKEFEEDIIFLRRKIHENPELGFAEYQTAELIASKLKDLGLEVQAGVGGTGVVGYLDCGLERTIALRADMDALPVLEETGLEFASKNKGIMHACGHDAHTAMVLGSAMVLSTLKDILKVNVKFVFQPCEETPPGGALAMIKDGVLDSPEVEAIFGIHVSPDLPVGTVAVSKGAQMAASDKFTLIIKGMGGHGAVPNEAVDSIVIAAEVVQALQTIVSRKTDPLKPVVVTVGMIKGGHKGNVIAEKVEMEGTIRTFYPDLRSKVPAWIEQVVKGITSAHNATCQLEMVTGRPPLINSCELVPLVENSAAQIVGRSKVVPQKPTMVGEDFAHYLEKIPGVYFYLGCNDGNKQYFCHHPRFDISEKVLGIGSAVLAQVACSYPHMTRREEDI